MFSVTIKEDNMARIRIIKKNDEFNPDVKQTYRFEKLEV